MDVVKRMTLWAAKQPRTEVGKLMLEAIEVIETLKQEILTQRHEIAQSVHEPKNG